MGVSCATSLIVLALFIIESVIVHIAVDINILIDSLSPWPCRCKVKVIDLDSYEVKHSWGGPGIEGGGLSSPSAIETIKIGSQYVLFLGKS